MVKKLKVVGVGGTFDEFHKGHEALLMKAFEVGDYVMIGLSSDAFVKRLTKSHATASYKERMTNLKSFLKKHKLLERAEVFPIDDIDGGVLLSKDMVINALVVSKETETTALKLNGKREKRGLKPFEIIVIDMIPSENHAPISTTRIRRGEIDREGRLLKNTEETV